MGRILDQIKSTTYPQGKVIGPKENCLVISDNIIKETRFSPGMAKMGYHGHGNELHKFTFYNEIKWLKKLKDLDFTPNLISYDDKLLTIEMNYVGKPLSSINIPKNWKKQCINILDKLVENNCSHNDIKPDDILVLNDKIYLVDYGWATEIKETIPSNWPDTIGGDFKFDIKNFNDNYSLFMSINHILYEK